MYDTVEEARQKLADSVVMLNGIPVYIQSVEGRTREVVLKFWALPLATRPTTQTPAESELLDNPLWNLKDLGSRLGYVNMVKNEDKGCYETVFATRVPVRSSRQGLDSRTVRVQALPVFHTETNWTNLIYTQGLRETMTGKFLTSHDVFNTITNEKERVASMAFSRKLAISWDKITPPTLWYRNEKIGYTEDGKTFKLAKHKNYLKEELIDMEGLKVA